MNPDMQDWERNHGLRFLQSLGLEPGHKVIDFGASVGHYTIPAAEIVGNSGSVYAIDIDDKALKMIRNKARIHMLKNIQLEKTNGRPLLEFGANTVDLVLLYDVLQYFDKDGRRKLFSEIKRVLKPDGVLSIFPKHLSDDEPELELANCTLDQLKDEIESHGFNNIDQRDEIVSYNEKLTKGRILNYSGSS